MNIFIYPILARNSLPALCAPYVKCYKPSPVAASPSRRNHFAAICALRATSSAMPGFWVQRTMTPAAIKTASYAAIRVPCVAIRTRLAARTANSCRQRWNVARHNTLLVSRRHVALAPMPSAQNRRPWPMEPFARSAASAAMASVYRTARRRVFRAACAISLWTHASDAVARASMRHASPWNHRTCFPMEHPA